MSSLFQHHRVGDLSPAPVIDNYGRRRQVEMLSNRKITHPMTAIRKITIMAAVAATMLLAAPGANASADDDAKARALINLYCLVNAGDASIGSACYRETYPPA